MRIHYFMREQCASLAFRFQDFQCYQEPGSSLNNLRLYELYGDQPEYPHQGGPLKPQLIKRRQTPRPELQHNNKPLHFRILIAAHERRFLILFRKRRQTPRFDVQHDNTPRHSRSRLARERRFLIPLRANQFSDLVLNTSLLD